MEAILDLYHLPYDPKHPVVCMDEKPYQLLDDVLVPIAMKPGSPKKIDYEYERKGTCSIFVFLEPLTGWTHANPRERRTAIDFAHEIKWLLTERFPNAEKVRIPLDNLNTHIPASLYKAFPAKEARELLRRIEFHYTPVHGSWLNMAEIAISILSRQCISKRIPDMNTLKNEINAWLAVLNNFPSPVNWQFTSDDARIKLRKLYPII